MTTYIKINMQETIGGTMTFILPDGVDPDVFNEDIRNQLDSEGIEEVERIHGVRLKATHRDTETCGMEVFEGESKSPHTTIAQYIATYLEEEAHRVDGDFGQIFGELDHHVANAVDAYEGGAR